VTPTPEPSAPERAGCDPAYPEERTCIPPGPPFDQGCAVTSERRFEVLPPDPQGLDHDGDGIGCEPIGAST
jgi:micrococcal nuclease